MYWWVLVKANQDGKNYVFGPFDSDTQAIGKGEAIGVIQGTYQLDTTDETRATRMIKAKRLNVSKLSHNPAGG